MADAQLKDLLAISLPVQAADLFYVQRGSVRGVKLAYSDLLAQVWATPTGILPVANGGTGTATPGLVAGTNITITGTWPNQQIDAAGGGGGGTVTHTGNLTLNALVLGNAVADTKVSTAFTTDGTSVLTVGVAGASASGALVIAGKTSGTLRIAVNDATARNITIGLSVQTTGDAMLVIPNMAGVGDTFVFNQLAGTLSNKTLFAQLIDGGLTATGAFTIDFSGDSGPFKSSTGACTMGSSMTVNGAAITNNIPQNIQNGSYTTVLSDEGKQIYASSSTGTWTIDSNANVAYPIGAAITFFVDFAGTRTIAITSDTLHWAGTSSSGSRTLTGYGAATAVKVASTVWLISGAGLT